MQTLPVDPVVLRLNIALHIAKGMRFLHEDMLIHFDLKSYNVLCNFRSLQEPRICIADMGLSAVLLASKITNQGGTPAW